VLQNVFAKVYSLYMFSMHLEFGARSRLRGGLLGPHTTVVTQGAAILMQMANTYHFDMHIYVKLLVVARIGLLHRPPEFPECLDDIPSLTADHT
jgi:hypothetical protein